jgi:hypothetical protein
MKRRRAPSGDYRTPPNRNFRWCSVLPIKSKGRIFGEEKMSSWVAPSVAAEIWGISIEQILAGVADGSFQSYVDGQFLFVDLEGRGYSKQPHPAPAENVVTEQELAALTFQPIDHQPTVSPQEEEGLRDTEDAEWTPEGSTWMPEEDSRDVALWRTARQQSARLRRPPTAKAA